MLPTALTEIFSGNTPFLALPLIGGALYILFHLLSSERGKFPSINDRQGFEVFYTNSRQRFLFQAGDLIRLGFQKYKNAFNIFTDIGPILILGPEYAHELRNDDRLSLQKFTSREFHSNIAGFEPFNVATVEAELMFNSIKQPLQQALGVLVEPLCTETTNALMTHWPSNSEWQDIELKPIVLQIVAQLSSKVFTGDDLCRNTNWHRILITYTINVYEAAQALTGWPKLLRPLVARFAPACQTLKAQIQETDHLLQPVVMRRRAQRETEKDAKGCVRITDRVPDAIDWMEDGASGRPFNPTTAHLLLSFAAIHSTADMLTQVLYDISSHPDILADMRKEIISVIPTHGWTRATLYNLKLMDSVLKESQRLKPTRMISMGRLAEQSIRLHDGLTVPKGTALMVSSHSMWDEAEYTDPRKFDGYRFLRMRERPGQENDHQLVAAAPNHMGFGYGKHVCPGRFFAANEVKIALCHILLKYDFRAVGDGDGARVISLGFNLFTNPMGKIGLRRRQEEICLDI